ncbi:thioesterase family protein [Bizionia paragorgiae]|jgi:acyl-CoA thioester hydrolase|uniref:Acyl-CoA thioester hydrolase n=1 Tax=Bizionia paragorgiae TaxID=283786 RepID=A0A1H3YCX9_BIZPA|nr:thioesterase family protein [Bizionia paragorgiae]MDX1270973.1 thioesterase family protein [Bizionia paragorgiae]SEA08874.1 acyl-CoA thioester hydrolase [Bizionia paragorgiae]
MNGKSHEVKIKVRYAETDQMGVVHHGNYALYLEVARIEWLSALGISYKKMEEDGIGLPVVSLQINYKKSAYYDDVLTVKTTLAKAPSVSVEFDYEIVNNTGEIIATAKTILAFIDMTKNRPTRPPKFFLEALKN